MLLIIPRPPKFSLRRDRTVELCRALIEAGTPLLWGCETRLDTLDDELIALMARAGCMRVAFGVDSINEGTLRLMRRTSGGTREIKAKAESLRRHGILTYAMYIVGLPGETRRTTERLVDFALELDTNAASFSMATPFPGTALERLGAKAGFIEKADPLHLTGCVPSMRNEELSMAEIESFYLSAKEKWNRRKSGSPQGRLPSALSSPL